jgi:hypothetical protein
VSADIEALNRDCYCVSLDSAALAAELDSHLGSTDLTALLKERCPHVFSAQPVFVSRRHLDRMSQGITAIESVVASDAYREVALARVPDLARIVHGSRSGVFLGYDFHLRNDRLGLIEINTNAGGAMLNAVLARAQRSCCAATDPLVPTSESIAELEAGIVAMFRREWHLAGRTAPLRRIAIVDEAPQQQYLYPEFLLFKRLFERYGIAAVITDPGSLEASDTGLHHQGLPVDLVYNRLTDFYFASGSAEALRDAWLRGTSVITPHPHAHALYADKRNLALLSDEAELKALGVDARTREVLLDTIPETRIVNPARATEIWDARRHLFFKPFAGYGSRAAYRGDKLTRSVWQQIIQGDYVAQSIVMPGERLVGAQQSAQVMKFDLRNYVYDGAVQWVAARVYQGQTTNFRTPGGGFAPVFSTPAPPVATVQAPANVLATIQPGSP